MDKHDFRLFNAQIFSIMTDNTIRRVPVSLDQEHNEVLIKLHSVLEKREPNGKRISVAEVIRRALKIALKHS